MKPQEAIPILERLQEPEAWEPHITMDTFDALDLAIEALNKEIPQKPMKDVELLNESLYRLYCPTCGNYIAYGNSRVGTLNKFTDSTDRCGYCGQKIDFGR